MFKSAVFKLTVLYLGIISIICLFFSFNLYDISTRELERGLRGQQRRLIQKRSPESPFKNEIESEIDDVYEIGKEKIIGRLILANVIILSIGGFGSYLLAKKTLRPIELVHESQKRFTADASHELRTPLASMKTEIEVALKDKNFNKKQAKEILKSNLEELDELSDLADSLLKLARDNESIDLNPVSLKSVILSAERKYEDGIEFRNNIGDFYVLGHEKHLKNLFTILFDNSSKYKSNNIVVEIATKHTKKHVIISVTDNGPGITKKDLPHIFERFYKGDTSRKSSNKSHGLGLSIARQIAILNHGEISALENNNGAHFEIVLKRI